MRVSPSETGRRVAYAWANFRQTSLRRALPMLFMAWAWVATGCPWQQSGMTTDRFGESPWEQRLQGNTATSPAVPLLVAVTPSRANLNAQAADGASEETFTTRLQLRAVVYYSDGSTDSTVTWSASDPALGTCQDGLVESGLDASSGSLVITARAQRGAVAGHAIITIETLGQAEVTVE